MSHQTRMLPCKRDFNKWIMLLKVHLHGSNLRTLECQYLEKRGPKFKIM